MKKVLVLIALLWGNYGFTAQSITLNYDFNQGRQGWLSGFADYPMGEQVFHELQSYIRELPSEVQKNKFGMYVSGNNHSDDLYMFLTKKITVRQGIKPSTRYRVQYEITFDSNVPSNCFGTGGAPGESVFLKASALNQSPKLYIDNLGFLRTRFSHGVVISNIANGIDCETGSQLYRRLTKRQSKSFIVQSNNQGELWLVVGTDSGFESKTSLYYEKIKVQLIH